MLGYHYLVHIENRYSGHYHRTSFKTLLITIPYVDGVMRKMCGGQNWPKLKTWYEKLTWPNFFYLYSMSVNCMCKLYKYYKNSASKFAKILILQNKCIYLCPIKYRMIYENRCIFLLIVGVCKYHAWDDLREGDASLQCLNFAVDLDRHYFAKEMYCPLPFETRRLLYRLCYAKGG